MYKDSNPDSLSGQLEMLFVWF